MSMTRAVIKDGKMRRGDFAQNGLSESDDELGDGGGDAFLETLIVRLPFQPSSSSLQRVQRPSPESIAGIP